MSSREVCGRVRGPGVPSPEAVKFGDLKTAEDGSLRDLTCPLY
jgi:hypothetical protein